MADADYHDSRPGLDDLIEDAVFPDAQAIGVLCAPELAYADGKGIVGQPFDGLHYAWGDLPVDPLELSQR